ncbi:nucleotide exchange factor GrpE [Buchnera aphidicola (Mollitrichosiphum nigrofasciatum)]|uniref:nucleotide exchange factor GrpE n=1 Tax=Buchnera aphidicola TaxID=9 RepID=UPI0031B83F0C
MNIKKKEFLINFKKKFNKIKKKRKEINLRMQAKLENTKKKIIIQQKTIKTQNIEKFFKKIIPIIDYLEDSISYLKKIYNFKNNTIKGLILILKNLHNNFKKYNIIVINNKKINLDKKKHKNIINIKNKENNSTNKIKKIIKKGYIRKNTILRKAYIETYK